jgi:hypothetical protein
MGETTSTGELAMGTRMALTPIGTARAGRGVSGRLKHSGGVCRGGWRALMARRRGDRAGEGWAREKELTGGVGLSAREVRARERAVRR